MTRLSRVCSGRDSLSLRRRGRVIDLPASSKVVAGSPCLTQSLPHGGYNMRTFPTFASRLLTVAALMLAAVPAAWSGSYKVLHVFKQNSQIPSSGLIVDAAGNGYGTTAKGGFNNAGTVYQLSPTTGYHIIYAFSGHPDGRNPQGNLVFDSAGNLYGTTVYGGTFANCSGGLGCGTVFKLTPSKNGGPWAETILYSFSGRDDGAAPQDGVILDANANLYGTTHDGGSSNAGTVFQLTPEPNNQWTQTVLYTFLGNGADGGGHPLAGLIFDAKGSLYGETTEAVFEMTLQSGVWTFNEIYTFDPRNGDGDAAGGGLIFDLAGNLYGTTKLGGGFGLGTVFQLTPNLGSWTEAILHSFGSGSDGAQPLAALAIDSAGDLYGTTFAGGFQNLGTVFKLRENGSGQWIETTFRFQPTQGGRPTSPLFLDSPGNIYGTAGVIFRITQ